MEYHEMMLLHLSIRVFSVQQVIGRGLILGQCWLVLAQYRHVSKKLSSVEL